MGGISIRFRNPLNTILEVLEMSDSISLSNSTFNQVKFNPWPVFLKIPKVLSLCVWVYVV